MRGVLVLFAFLVTSGCTQEIPSRDAKTHPIYHWDVSADRSATAFTWFDFDPVRGAIDGPGHLHLTFDQREFDGDIELITIGRAYPQAKTLQSIHINLPAQTAAELVKTLKTLAKE